MIARQNLSFTKMKAVCELEKRHGAELGQGYENDRACATFVECIAREQQEQLTAALSRSKFFSLQADGSTDSGNVEDELFLVLHSLGSTLKAPHLRTGMLLVLWSCGGGRKLGELTTRTPTQLRPDLKRKRQRRIVIFFLLLNGLPVNYEILSLSYVIRNCYFVTSNCFCVRSN